MSKPARRIAALCLLGLALLAVFAWTPVHDNLQSVAALDLVGGKPVPPLLHRLVAEPFTILPVTAAHFRTAARFADQHTLGLRAADAASRDRL